MSDDIVRVAAAVIIRADGRVLLAQRPPGKAYAGYWEFPGGKLEADETPRHALDRELREELGLSVRRAAPWLVQRYRYPHAHVELNFFRVFDWTGEPVGHDGQQFSWQTPSAIDVEPLLPANTFVLRALVLPAIYGITRAEELGESVSIARAQVALEKGLRLIQLREKNWPIERQRAVAESLVPLAHRYCARVLLNGAVEHAKDWGCDGVHWTSALLSAADARPPSIDLLCAASCHTREDIDKAAKLGIDFVVLGPVFPTPSHPGAATLGWSGFSKIAEGTSIPIYALGGLRREDLDTAIDHGAHGIALRGQAWG